MTVDVFGYAPEDFIDGVEFAGAAAFMAERPQRPRHHVRLRRSTRSCPRSPRIELVDARDLMCPMPVMAATKAMRRLRPGQVLKVLATDRGSLGDIPAWAEANEDEMLESRRTERRVRLLHPQEAIE